MFVRLVAPVARSSRITGKRRQAPATVVRVQVASSETPLHAYERVQIERGSKKIGYFFFAAAAAVFLPPRIFRAAQKSSI
jgi:hypothetical protein